MFKQRVVRIVAAIALAVALSGGYVIGAEVLGIDSAPTVHACSGPNVGGGGGC